MNYTEKYHLPQWKKEDRVMMEDFNQMCANLEEGIAKAQGAADAAYAPDFPPFVIGTYTGTGDEPQTIITGFKPRAVIITGQTIDGSSDAAKTILIGGPGIMSIMLHLLDDGFRIALGHSGSVVTHPRMNTQGKTYLYIAFR